MANNFGIAMTLVLIWAGAIVLGFCCLLWCAWRSTCEEKNELD